MVMSGLLSRAALLLSLSLSTAVAADNDFFEKRVRPVLAGRIFPASFDLK